MKITIDISDELEDEVIKRFLLRALDDCESCKHKDDRKVIKHLKAVADYCGVKY